MKVDVETATEILYMIAQNKFMGDYRVLYFDGSVECAAMIDFLIAAGKAEYLDVKSPFGDNIINRQVVLKKVEK